MKLAIVGSRSFNNYALLFCTISANYADTAEIISGGAYGADKLAERYACEHSIKLMIILPNWQEYGRAAGPIRNKLIIEQCDEVLAFWDGVSSGTKNSIDIAAKLGKPCRIVTSQANQQ